MHNEKLALADLCLRHPFCLDRESSRGYSLFQTPQWCLWLQWYFQDIMQQQGCVLSWRGRQHRVEVVPCSVENSWDSNTNSWSFHPTSFDPFWKGCLFSFFLPALSAKGLSPLQSCGTRAQHHCSTATLWLPDGIGGVWGREETQHLCTLEPFTMTFVADAVCLVVLVKSC